VGGARLLREEMVEGIPSKCLARRLNTPHCSDRTLTEFLQAALLPVMLALVLCHREKIRIKVLKYASRGDHVVALSSWVVVRLVARTMPMSETRSCAGAGVVTAFRRALTQQAAAENWLKDGCYDPSEARVSYDR